MPSSLIRTFFDPDEYGSAVRQSTYDITVTQRGKFVAKLIQIDLHRLWMQHNEEALSRIAVVELGDGRVVIGFLTEAGPELIRRGVATNTADLVVRLARDQTMHHVSTGVVCYGTMSLPVVDVDALGGLLAGRDLTAPDFLFVKPAPEIMDRVQRLHAAARHLAKYTPAVLTHPEAARGLEQALVGAMIGCFGYDENGEDRATLRRHATIMRRFQETIDASTDQPLYLPDLCRKIGVSDRTLRACCEEQFGIGPKRYLMLRRLHLARRALRGSVPGSTTVTEIAAQYGFWQFGRFAAEYRAIFGENPSATLRSPA